MNFEEIQGAWREVQGKKWAPDSAAANNEEVAKMVETAVAAARYIERRVFWRDVTETSLGVLMAAIFVRVGSAASTRWPWFGAALLCSGVAGFFVVDRWRRRRARDVQGTVGTRLGRQLEDIEHQIWLLDRVAWWYLLPLSGAVALILGGVAWDVDARLVADGAHSAVRFFAATVWLAGALFVWVVFGGVRQLNRKAASGLREERDRIAATVSELADETAIQGDRE